MGRNMDRWLGDGGMPVIEQFGASIDGYGEGWATATWTPTEVCANPAGIVQAGVHAVLLDALMNFAMLASLESGERGATLEMKVSTMRPARAGDTLSVRGEVVRLARQVAYTEAWVRSGGAGGQGGDGGEGGDGGGDVVAHATGTFIVRRND